MFYFGWIIKTEGLNKTPGGGTNHSYCKPKGTNGNAVIFLCTDMSLEKEKDIVKRAMIPVASCSVLIRI